MECLLPIHINCDYNYGEWEIEPLYINENGIEN